jgi:hypothetical protein
VKIGYLATMNDPGSKLTSQFCTTAGAFVLAYKEAMEEHLLDGVNLTSVFTPIPTDTQSDRKIREDQI